MGFKSTRVAIFYAGLPKPNATLLLYPGLGPAMVPSPSKGGGPIEKYCKLTPEEVAAARKGKGLAEKVQSKLSTEKQEEKRDRACEYICQFFYEAGIPHNTVTLPSLKQLATMEGT